MIKRSVVRWSLAAVLLLSSVQIVEAQQAVVRGRVVDAASGAPVASATIRAQGTNLGTLSEEGGTYTLELNQTGAIHLLASKIGYKQATKTVTVSAGDTITVDFALAVTRIQMTELVASVGAEQTQRREVGHSVSVIDVSNVVTKAATNTFSDLLNGRSESLVIERASGMTGMGSRVRIRGVNSLTQSNNPLVVIDGIRADNNTNFSAFETGGQSTSRFEDLDPDNIASIQVMKGPTAAALYGSEAAAGVLVITTKSGQGIEHPEIQLHTTQGFVQDNNQYPNNYGDVTTGYGITSLSDPRLAQFQAVKNPLTGTVFLVDNPFMNPDTRPFRRGHHQQYGGSISGSAGAEAGFQYYGSVDYRNEAGTFVSNGLERFNGRANLSIQASDQLRLEFNTGFIASTLTFPNDNSIATGLGVNGMLGIPMYAYGTDPQKGPGKGICALDALQNLPNGTTGACKGRNGNFRTSFPNLATLDQGESIGRFIGSGSVEYKPWHWLTNRVIVGLDQVNLHDWQLYPYDPTLPFGSASLGQITDQNSTDRIFTVDLASTATHSLTSSLTSTTSVGAQYFSKRRQGTACSGAEFPSNNVSSCDAAIVVRGANMLLENIELGGYGRERLGLNDYLWLTGALRVDNNSALGQNQGVIWSPSANFSAVFNDMPFWKDVGPLTSLRVRAAWGKASQSPDQYARDRTYANAPTIVDGQTVTGITPADPGNPNLGPERTEEFEGGLDAGLFNDRVGVDFSYYHSKTTNLIVPKPVAPSTGFPNVSYVNLGAMKNHGIELSIDAQVLETKTLSWNLHFIHSTSHPIITNLGLAQPIIFPVGAEGGSRAAGSQVFASGAPPGAYISPVINNAERDANGNITGFTFAPGNLGDGSNRRIVGNPNVGNEQSLSTTITLFGNLELYTLFDRRGGFQLLNVNQAFRTPFIDNPSFSSFSREYAFRQVDSSPEVQAMIEQHILAPFIENGDFIKWRELSLSYELPKRVRSLFGLNLQGVRLTVGGRNLHTFTSFSGLDPEVNVRGARDGFIRNNFAGIGVPNYWYANLDVRF